MKKKVLSTALALAMTLTLLPAPTMAANEETVDYASYQKGVTVEADAASPTGYIATFVYAEKDSYTTNDGKTLGDIVKVELYSDCMMVLDVADGSGGTLATQSPNVSGHSPSEYKDGLFPGGGSGSTTYYAEMVEFADGLWGARVPLPSGAIVYNFRVTDADGVQLGRLDDPSNPTLWNTATNNHSLSSLVYVPYAAVQGSGTFQGRNFADRSVEMPQTDAAKKGTVKTVAYEASEAGKPGLAIYLPAGYDASRAEPYPVLYLSHGTSSDLVGNELRWLNEGAAANIMDNLIAAGKAEPFVVVCADNQLWNDTYSDWVWADIVKETPLIIDYVEANYNVRTDRAGRAYAGLSRGGEAANYMLQELTDVFSYYGIWSYASKEINDETAAKLVAAKDSTHIMLSAGYWDFGKEYVLGLGEQLKALGLAYDYLELPAAHDWENWQLTFAYAVENFFFKAGDTKPALRFDDVADDAWYAKEVAWAVENGVTSGTGDNKFSPDQTCTQAQILTMLYAAIGKPEVTLTVSPYANVTSDNYYYKPVLWAYEKGFLSSETFDPNAPCTRADTITYLWLSAGAPPKEAAASFSDVAADADYAQAVTWAIEENITAGMGDGTFGSALTCTRAHIATFLYRCFGR